MRGSADRAETRIAVVGRRDVLAGAGAAALIALILRPAAARANADTPTFADAMKAILGDAKPSPKRILLELPEIAENGNTVPFTITVDSPMTPQDFVKAAHIVSSANPQPSVASFYFTEMSGRAIVSSRMRLAKSQEVVAIAELSNGSFLIATRNVKVTIGGCGG